MSYKDEDCNIFSNESLDILGYCSYCKDPIFVDDDYEDKVGRLYHSFCWFQKTNYISPYEEQVNTDDE